jgi:hypothetical protein
MDGKMDDTEVRPYDILCGRSKNCFNNIGNRRFRITISMNVKKFDALRSRNERSKFIVALAHTLKHEVGFRFLQNKKGGEQVELTIEEIRAKIGHALRDLSIPVGDGVSSTPDIPISIVTPPIQRKTCFCDDTAQKKEFIVESMMPSLDENPQHEEEEEEDTKIPAVISSSTFCEEEKSLVRSHPKEPESEEDADFFPLPYGEPCEGLLEQFPLPDLLPTFPEQILPARTASVPMMISDSDDEDLYFRRNHSFPSYTQDHPPDKVTTMSIASNDDYLFEKSLCDSVDCLSLDSH